MKRLNLTSVLIILKLNPSLILMCGIFTFCSFTAFGQKGTCIINNQIVHDCDLRGMSSICEKNGQIYPCNKTTTAKTNCGDGGLLIIKLNSAGTYYERFRAYEDMSSNIRCRGSKIGFFRAASDVTHTLFADETFPTFSGEYAQMANTFLQLTSTALVQVKTAAFKELTETGKLLGLEGRYLTDPEEIDRNLVMGEQLLVEKALQQTGVNRGFIVLDINARMKWILDNRPDLQGGPVMAAIAEVRKNRRLINRYAEYDYGNLYDRVAVGEILAKRRRN